MAFLRSNTFGDFLPEYFLYGIAFVIFAFSLHCWPQIAFVNKFTVSIGKLSFSIYLVHFMILNIMGLVFGNGFVVKGNLGFALAFALVFSLSVLFSYVIYKVIESPGISLGKYIIQKL